MMEKSREKFIHMAMITAIVLTAVILTGCRTQKSAENTDTKDSVRIEYREKVVEVPVTVYVEIPAESKQRETTDTTSTLETSFAKSTASVRWNDGIMLLSHSLWNKPQVIEKTDSVDVVEKERTVWKTRRVTYTKTVTVIKNPPWWKNTLAWIGGLAIIAIAIFIILKLCK